MFSLCIPTYNRVFETLDSFSLVLDNSKISEVVIHDDGSQQNFYEKLKRKLALLGNTNIKLYAAEQNAGAFVNKYRTVKAASCEWIILLDSDNRINNNYVEILSMQDLQKDTVYMPSIANCSSPLLDYSQFSNMCFDKAKYCKGIGNQKFEVLLNTGNYCINRESYLKAYEDEENRLHTAADVFYMNYLMMKNNPEQKFYVVPGLTYEHRLSKDSYWVQNSAEADHFTNKLKKTIREWL